MKTKSKSNRRVTRRFSVGGKVYVPFGKHKRIARIIEDRGNIGRGGRKLLRVAFIRPNGQIEQVFEIPAAEVATVGARTVPKATAS